jgi:hypothetical protein
MELAQLLHKKVDVQEDMGLNPSLQTIYNQNQAQII